MAGLFKNFATMGAMMGAGAPKPRALPPMPDDSFDRIAAERRKKYEAQRTRGYASSGRRGTLLTGGMGLTTDFQSERKTLLGR